MKKVKSYDMTFDYAMFQNDVRAFLEAHELTHTELDTLAGAGAGTTSAILKGNKANHKMQTWIRIANAMDIDVRTYFVLDI